MTLDMEHNEPRYWYDQYDAFHDGVDNIIYGDGDTNLTDTSQLGIR